MESTLDWSQETMVSQLPLFWVWRKETALGRKGAWVKVLALEFTSLSHLGQDITLLPKSHPIFHLGLSFLTDKSNAGLQQGS